MMTLILTLSPCTSAIALAGNGAQHEPISLTLQDADLVDVLKTMARIVGAEAEIDPVVSGTISINFSEISWMTALDGICESGGCQWQLIGRTPRRLKITHAEPLSEDAAALLDRPISITLKGAAIEDVIKQFGIFMEREVKIDGQPTGSVSLGIDQISVRTALSMVCESVGCSWQLADGVLQVSVADRTRPATTTLEEVKVLIEEPISLTLEQADAANVLKTFGRLLGCRIVISDQVSGQVDIELDRVPAGQALSQVCDQVGCKWALSSEDGAAVIQIDPR